MLNMTGFHRPRTKTLCLVFLFIYVFYQSILSASTVQYCTGCTSIQQLKNWEGERCLLESASNSTSHGQQCWNFRTNYGGWTATKITFMYSFSWNCAASVQISTIIWSVSDLYIPRICPHIWLQQNFWKYINLSQILYMSVGIGRHNIKWEPDRYICRILTGPLFAVWEPSRNIAVPSRHAT